MRSPFAETKTMRIKSNMEQTFINKKFINPDLLDAETKKMYTPPEIPIEYCDHAKRSMTLGTWIYPKPIAKEYLNYPSWQEKQDLIVFFYEETMKECLKEAMLKENISTIAQFDIFRANSVQDFHFWFTAQSYNHFQKALKDFFDLDNYRADHDGDTYYLVLNFGKLYIKYRDGLLTEKFPIFDSLTKEQKAKLYDGFLQAIMEKLKGDKRNRQLTPDQIRLFNECRQKMLDEYDKAPTFIDSLSPDFFNLSFINLPRINWTDLMDFSIYGFKPISFFYENIFSFGCLGGLFLFLFIALVIFIDKKYHIDKK